MARFLLVLLAAAFFLGLKQTIAATQPYCSCMVNQTSKQVDGLMSGVLLLNKQAHECDKRLDRLEASLIVLRHRVNNQLQNQVDQLQKLLQRKYCARETIAEGLETTLIINRTTQFTVLVRDFEGHDLSSGGHNVTVDITSLDFSRCVSTEPKITDNDDGSYLVTLTPECSGNNQITVKINGKAIKGMPVTAVVIPSYASLKLKHKITGVVNGARGIATAKNGDIFVASWPDGLAFHFDKNGKKLNHWRAAPRSNVHKVLLHGNHIYVAQCHPNKLLKYTLNRTLVQTTLLDGCYYDLEIGPDSRLYATNFFTSRIRSFNTDDDCLFNEITGLSSPVGIAFDPQAYVHVTNYNSPVIRVFSSSGVFVRSYTQPSASVGCRDIHIDKAGNVLTVVRGNPDTVIITDKDNNLLQKLTFPPPSFASSITIASNGNVWITVPQNEIFIYSH